MNKYSNDIIISVGMDSEISFWVADQGTLHDVVRIHDSRPINCVSRFNQTEICVGTNDKRVVFIDIFEKKKKLEIDRGFIGAITTISSFPDSFHPKLLLLGSSDWGIYVHDTSLKEDQVSIPFRLRGHLGCVLDIVSLSDGLFASSSMDKKIKIWDLKIGSGRCISTIFPGHTRRTNGLKFDRNNSLLYSCSSDRTIKVWKITNTLQTHRIEKPNLTIRNNHPIQSLDQHQDYVLFGDWDGNIKMTDIRYPTTSNWISYLKGVHDGHSVWDTKFLLSSLLPSSIGRSVDPKCVSCSTDCSVQIHGLRKSETEVKMRTKYPVYSVLPLGNFDRVKTMCLKEEKERVYFLVEEISKMEDEEEELAAFEKLEIHLLKKRKGVEGKNVVFVCPFLFSGRE